MRLLQIMFFASAIALVGCGDDVSDTFNDTSDGGDVGQGGNGSGGDSAGGSSQGGSGQGGSGQGGSGQGGSGQGGSGTGGGGGGSIPAGCEACVQTNCPTEYNTCNTAPAAPGCQLILECAFDSGCTGLDCLGPCGGVINANGGVTGAPAQAAIALANCALTPCMTECTP